MTKTKTPAATCSIIGLALLAMMLVWQGGAMALSSLIQWMEPKAMENFWVTWLLNDIPLYLLGMPAFLLLCALLPNQTARPRSKARLGFGRYLLLLLFCFGAVYLGGYISYYIDQIVAAVFGNPPNVPDFSMPMDTSEPGFAIGALFFGACVPAFGEEFIFRYVIRQKMQLCSDRTYIFFSALCFAMFHANLSQILFAFVVGAVFAWVYVQTRNIWLPVSLHFIINTMGYLVSAYTLEYAWLDIAMTLFVLLAMPTAIVLFFVFRNKVFATMMPPTDQRWPYQPSRSQLTWLLREEQKQALRQGNQLWQPSIGAGASGFASSGYGMAYGAAPPYYTSMPGAPAPYAPAYSPAYGPYGQAPWPAGSPAYPVPPAQAVPYPTPMQQPTAPSSYGMAPAATAFGAGTTPGWQPVGYGGAPTAPAIPGYATYANAPYTLPPGKLPGRGGVVRICLGNVGMILYLLLTIGLTLLMLVAPYLIAWAELQGFMY